MFIEQARKVHGDFYDYSKSTYQGQHYELTIRCPLHGLFNMRPNNHVRGKQRCPLCGAGKKRTTRDFVILAKEVHGENYDYSQVTYKSAKTNVNVICPEHGLFKITPDSHIGWYRQGCPRCKASRGERAIFRELVKIGITNFVCEKSFDGLVTSDTKLPLRFDFYLPEQNLLIEFDGHAHFDMVNYSGKMSTVEMKKRLSRTKQLDKIKDKWAVDNNITLLRIPYWEYNNILIILKEYL